MDAEIAEAISKFGLPGFKAGETGEGKPGDAMDPEIANAIQVHGVPGFLCSLEPRQEDVLTPESAGGMDPEITDAIQAAGLAGFRCSAIDEPREESTGAMDPEIAAAIQAMGLPGFKTRSAVEVVAKPAVEVVAKPAPTVTAKPLAKRTAKPLAKRYDVKLQRNIGEVTADGAFMLCSRDPVGDLFQRLKFAGQSGPVSLRIMRGDLSHVMESITIGNTAEIDRVRAEIREKEVV